MPSNSPRCAGTHRAYRNAPSGFTLIELLVVVLIIGILSAAVVLSIGVTGRDRELEQEGERLSSLLTYVREKAELQTHEFGLYCHDSDYEFLTFDPRKSLWRSVDEDDSLRSRNLPDGLKLRLIVEGRPVILKRREDDPAEKARKEQEEKAAKADKDKDKGSNTTRSLGDTDQSVTFVPHVILFSNGDLTPFKLTVEREEAGRSITMASNDKGLIETGDLTEEKKR